jgi:HEAT repeat protein
MGPKAKTAVPALVELLGKRGLSAQESAAEALGRIGDPRAVPALLAAAERGMTKSDTQLSGVTANAVRSLGEIGAEPDTVVPLLLRVLASERRDFMSVRAQAETLLALERFDVRTPAVLEALQAFLDGDPGENRVTAKYVLAKLSRKP